MVYSVEEDRYMCRPRRENVGRHHDCAGACRERDECVMGAAKRASAWCAGSYSREGGGRGGGGADVGGGIGRCGGGIASESLQGRDRRGRLDYTSSRCWHILPPGPHTQRHLPSHEEFRTPCAHRTSIDHLHIARSLSEPGSLTLSFMTH